MVNVTITLYRFDELSTEAKKWAAKRLHALSEDEIEANGYFFYADGELAHTTESGLTFQRSLTFHSELIELPAAQTVWACNSCRFQDYSGVVSANDIKLLQCSNCGGDEFHLVKSNK